MTNDAVATLQRARALLSKEDWSVLDALRKSYISAHGHTEAVMALCRATVQRPPYCKEMLASWEYAWGKPRTQDEKLAAIDAAIALVGGRVPAAA